ncbi:MAG: phospho-sugar mutase [Ruminococcaceae bacterium]|nr:phospho-sugar mutase [Oscillospiraceae bacterium]
MTYRDKYNEWLTFDEKTKSELEAITDEKEIEDRFYKDLAFGTGGLRGVMGAGTNRMNAYTVGKATLGLARYLKSKNDGELSVAIACDSRLNSKEFLWAAARVFASEGIKVYAFSDIVPVPVLSFTTRYHNCTAGVMITASHNPKEYNGYKVYDNKGCQFCTEDAKNAIAFINEINDYRHIYDNCKTADEYISQGVIECVYTEELNEFVATVETQAAYQEKNNLKIVYTPLHGTGRFPVLAVLDGMDVTLLDSQKEPDGNFPTVKSPNPEDRAALTLAIEKAKEIGADLVLGTDPDCDRVGIAVLHNGEYVLFTGNQTGALLVNFILTMRKSELNEKSTLVKTIVTSELGANIGRKFGLQVEETLTGFKYIGDKINKYEANGDKEFVIGYEESYGYLVGTHARDKDAVVSSMLICQMAAWYKNQGKTLVDGLNEIYAEYGYYLDFLDSFVLKGKDGAEKIQSLMVYFRETGNALFDGIEEIIDYKDGILDLPKENVLKYIWNDGSWMAVRPSGTEPKIKVYYSIVDENRDNAKARLETIREKIKSIIEG